MPTSAAIWRLLFSGFSLSSLPITSRFCAEVRSRRRRFREKELYDLEKDPNELNNIVRIPNYFPIRNYLHRELRDLEDCVGRGCHEEASEIPLTRKERQADIRRKKRELRENRKEQKEQKR